MTGHWDPTWESLFAARPWGKYPAESVVRAVMRAFGGVPDRSEVHALDLGCGPGANTWFLAREGFQVSGIDGSATAIRQAGERLAADGLTADLRVGDFTATLPWVDSTFDVAVDCAALYANPPAGILSAVTEVHRVLKPGGMFVSLAFSDRTWGFGTGQPAKDPGGFVNVAEGPMTGTGYVQFHTRQAVDQLYRVFRRRTVETTSYTMEGMQRVVELWIITCWRDRG